MQCPVYQVEVVEERTVEILVAAETRGQAEVVAKRLARLEMDWCVRGYDVHGWPVDPTTRDAGDGIWVQGRNNGRGEWVHDLEDLPELPPRPDPNQLALDLGDERRPAPVVAEWGVTGTSRSETVQISGGVL